MKLLIRCFLVLLPFTTVPLYSKDIKWDAVEYFNNSTGQQQLALYYFKQLSLDNPHNILDIGCGDGKITAYIARCYPNARVIGIDNSLEMITFAQRHFSNIPNLQFVLTDAQDIMYENQFDVITSFFCLHWVQDQEVALKALAKAAQHTADVLLIFSNQPDQPILQSLRYANSLPAFKDYFVTYEPPVHPIDHAKLIRILQENGCSIVSCQKDAKKDIFNNVNDFYNFLMPLADSMPSFLLTSYIQVVICEYIRHCPVLPNGNIVYESPVAVVHAKK